MAAGVTIYCDSLGPNPHCTNTLNTRSPRAEYARDQARQEGWTRRLGIDLCPTCSTHTYGPDLKIRRRRRP